MYKVIAVTNRKLCPRSLQDQIEHIASITTQKKPDILILREKDLLEKDYEELAKKVIEQCGIHQIDCILHTYLQVAIRLGCRKIHLPISKLEENSKWLKEFEERGVSVHSVEEAIWAEKKGVSYITAGHIFKTDCKKDVSPRGLAFLKEVCEKVSIPVYAIGGMNEQNVDKTIKMGAKGVCIMSGFMKA